MVISLTVVVYMQAWW